MTDATPLPPTTPTSDPPPRTPCRDRRRRRGGTARRGRRRACDLGRDPHRPGRDHGERTITPTTPTASAQLPGTTAYSAQAATAEQQTGVVLIETETTDGAAAGTGLVVDASGLVLTNYHVVEGSTSIRVTIASTGETHTATVVGHDQTSDIALLRLPGASDLTTATLDDDGDPAVSDSVTAVGNAQGQGSLSVATGTVTALDQSISTRSDRTVAGEDLGGLIETDASVVGGYSGGALLDSEREVVGVATAASGSGQPESYAVPIDDAIAIVTRIEQGQESAQVQVGPSAYLGVAVQDTGAGAVVGQVEQGSPAAQAGIASGAQITAVGGAAVSSLDRLRAALITHEPGTRVTVCWRDASGDVRRASVRLGSSPVN